MQVFFITCFFGLALSEDIVSTTSGTVRGTTAVSDDVNAFLGIPYAEPPVKELRFAKPIPKKPWKQIYNAINLPPPCAQLSRNVHYFFPDITNMSEDCLYLNLWVPKYKYHDGLRPVVIFIHGGAFIIGTSSMKFYDGSKLASRGNLIVVTINYRLGAFGYFMSHTEDSSGSVGMYDQIMAMRWIKDNAKNFGGDPENIVLMGQSAGAFSISMHMVSPLSKKLFKKAIFESGSGLSPYLNDNNVRLFEHSQSLASITGCTNETSNLKTDPHSVVECLKFKPKEAIIEAEIILSKMNLLTFFPATNNEFLPKSSTDLFLEGKFRKDVDVLLGFNRDEGNMMISLALPEYFGHYGMNNTQTISKSFAKSITRTELFVLGQKKPSEIVQFYISRVKNRTSHGYTQMIADSVGDFIINCPTLFLADILSLKGNSVYFYKFEFRAASTPVAEWIGVSHTDELQYVFGSPFHNNFTDEEVELSNRLIDRWSAFARTGNPNIPNRIPWFRYNYHNRLYISFGQEEETLRMDPVTSCGIWEKRFGVHIDADLIRFLRNSSMNKTIEDTK